MIRATYTYVLLELSPDAYDEIAQKMREAGYAQAFGDEGEIDMHGIAVTRDNEAALKLGAAVRAAGLAGP